MSLFDTGEEEFLHPLSLKSLKRILQVYRQLVVIHSQVYSEETMAEQMDQQYLAAVLRFLKQSNLTMTADALKKEAGLYQQSGSEGNHASLYSATKSNPEECRLNYQSENSASEMSLDANTTRTPLQFSEASDDDRGTADSGYFTQCQQSHEHSDPSSRSTPTIHACLASPLATDSRRTSLTSTHSEAESVLTFAAANLPTTSINTPPQIVAPFIFPTVTSGITSAPARPLITPFLTLVPQPVVTQQLGRITQPPFILQSLVSLKPTTANVTSPVLATSQFPGMPEASPFSVGRDLRISSSDTSSPPIADITEAEYSTMDSSEGGEGNQPSIADLRSFAAEFRRRRIALGYTQGAVGVSLAKMGFANFAQSTISRFEQMQLSPRNAASIRDVLSAWLKQAERYPQGALTNIETLPSTAHLSLQGSALNYTNRKRKKRAVFAPPAKRVLNDAFLRDPKPTRTSIEDIARELDMLPEEVRVWFCNKRQKEKGHSTSSLEYEKSVSDSPVSSTSSENSSLHSTHPNSCIPTNFTIEEMSKSASGSPESSLAGSPRPQKAAP